MEPPSSPSTAQAAHLADLRNALSRDPGLTARIAKIIQDIQTEQWAIRSDSRSSCSAEKDQFDLDSLRSSASLIDTDRQEGRRLLRPPRPSVAGSDGCSIEVARDALPTFTPRTTVGGSGAQCEHLKSERLSIYLTVMSRLDGRRPVVRPWIVPRFGGDGLPSTFDNPYIPEPVQHAFKSIVTRHADADVTPRQTPPTDMGGDGASNPFIFPLLISTMLILVPILFVSLVGMFLLDWRGGISAGWGN